MSEHWDDPSRENPNLDAEEDRRQRGEDPEGAFGGTTPDSKVLKDDEWDVPDPALFESIVASLRRFAPATGLNRQEMLLPYLLVRGRVGDLGKRPLDVFWESPDIGLMPGHTTGPYDPALAIHQPAKGEKYRTFVHAWNLGGMAAVGARAELWSTRAGFFGGTGADRYQAERVAGAYFSLDDRSSAQCHRWVEMQPAWHVGEHLSSHECLLASISCPADPWDGSLWPQSYRHVAQRNLTLLDSADSAVGVLAELGAWVRQGADLEILANFGDVPDRLAILGELPKSTPRAKDGVGVVMPNGDLHLGTLTTAPALLQHPREVAFVPSVSITGFRESVRSLPSRSWALGDVSVSRGLRVADAVLSFDLKRMLDPSINVSESLFGAATARGRVPRESVKHLSIDADCLMKGLSEALSPAALDGKGLAQSVSIDSAVLLRVVEVVGGRVAGGYSFLARSGEK